MGFSLGGRPGRVPPVRSEKSIHRLRGRRDICLLNFSGRLFQLSNVWRTSGDRRLLAMRLASSLVGRLLTAIDLRVLLDDRLHQNDRRRPGTCRGLPLRESMKIKGRSCTLAPRAGRASIHGSGLSSCEASQWHPGDCAAHADSAVRPIRLRLVALVAAVAIHLIRLVDVSAFHHAPHHRRQASRYIPAGVAR